MQIAMIGKYFYNIIYLLKIIILIIKVLNNTKNAIL